MAAMEPVQIGRDDHTVTVSSLVHYAAAMEPVQIGRDDLTTDQARIRAWAAAMEPVQIGRDDRHSVAVFWLRLERRNGARPDRTG